MKFGLTLFGIPTEEVVVAAQHAEALGYESVWQGDQVVFPYSMASKYPHAGDGAPVISDPARSPRNDVLTVMAAAAGATQRLRLGTAIFLLPLRDPFTVARAITTIDRISNGRFMFGVGRGWMREEFELTDRSYDNRTKRFEEQIEVLRMLWREERPEFHGQFHDFGAVGFEPKPVNGSIPIYLGGGGDVALKRAATLGDGWIASRTPPLDEVVAQARTVLRHRAESEDADRPFELTAQAPPGPVDPAWLSEIEAAGFHRVVVQPWAHVGGPEWYGRDWKPLSVRAADELGLANRGS